MKKFAVIAVAASMFALTACSDEPSTPTPPTEEPTTPPVHEPKQPPCTGPDGRQEANCNIP